MNDNLFLTEALKMNAQLEISEMNSALKNAPPHNFSPEFEKKMNYLIKHHKPIVHHSKKRFGRLALKFAACFMAFALIFAVVPTSKASFRDFVAQFFENYIAIFFNKNSVDSVTETLPDIEIGYLPEGYEKIIEKTDPLLRYIKYRNGTSEIEINYCSNDSSNSFFNSEGYDIKEMTIAGNHAKLFTNPSNSNNNAVIIDVSQQYILVVSTNLNAETLVKIAENIKFKK